MDDVNPYNEPLDNIYHIFNRLSLDTRVKDNEFEEINLFEVNKLIDEINEKIDNIINVREDIIKEKHENDEAIVFLKILKLVSMMFKILSILHVVLVKYH